MQPDESLAFDAALGAGVNASITFGAPPPLKFGRAKTFTNRCNLRQLLSLSANISGTDEDNNII